MFLFILFFQVQKTPRGTRQIKCNIHHYECCQSPWYPTVCIPNSTPHMIGVTAAIIDGRQHNTTALCLVFMYTWLNNAKIFVITSSSLCTTSNHTPIPTPTTTTTPTHTMLMVFRCILIQGYLGEEHIKISLVNNIQCHFKGILVKDMSDSCTL